MLSIGTKAGSFSKTTDDGSKAVTLTCQTMSGMATLMNIVFALWNIFIFGAPLAACVIAFFLSAARLAEATGASRPGGAGACGGDGCDKDEDTEDARRAKEFEAMKLRKEKVIAICTDKHVDTCITCHSHSAGSVMSRWC